MNSIKHYSQKGAVARPFIIVVIIAAITIAIIWLLHLTKPQPQANLQTPIPVNVQLIDVQQRNVQPFEEVTGRLQPFRSAQIRFEVAGQVNNKLVQAGTLVNEGAILLQLGVADYRDQLRQSESELVIEKETVVRDKQLLAYAQENLALQKEELQRLEKLVGRKLIAQSQVDSTRQLVFDLQAEVSRLEFSVATANARVSMQASQRDMAQRNFDRTSLRAPFTGVVNDIFVEEGDYVDVNQTALSLVDVSAYELRLDIRGELAANLALQQSIQVQFDERTLDGEIISLQTDPDPNTNTHEIKIKIQGDSLQAGRLAVAVIPLSLQQDALVIPVSSVASLQGRYFVYVYDEGKIHKTIVKLSRRVDDNYMVLSGLNVGDKIVARDVLSLADEQLVVTE